MSVIFKSDVLPLRRSSLSSITGLLFLHGSDPLVLSGSHLPSFRRGHRQSNLPTFLLVYCFLKTGAVSCHSSTDMAVILIRVERRVMCFLYPCLLSEEGRKKHSWRGLCVSRRDGRGAILCGSEYTC